MKILLVDDSKSARYALRLQLQRHGITVDAAESAEAAFVKLKTTLPDAILMDHMMPGLNGFEAFDILREDPRTADIPVVMCTSNEEPEFVATAKKKGVFGVLPKSAASEFLPEMLGKLQAATGMTSVQSGDTDIEASLSKEAVVTLVETSVDAYLSQRLPALLEELDHDLMERILNETRRMIEERSATEQAIKRNAAPQPTMADLQAISTRLATETVPDLIKRAIKSERDEIMTSMEKYVRDTLPKTGSEHDGQESDEQQILTKASAIARRESQDAVNAALTTSQQSIQMLELSLKKAKGTLYGLVALAALLGMGAAGAVFYLLGGL